MPTFESVRDTVAFLVEESTEGTPVAPSAGTDAIKLQNGFAVAPNFNVLENQELTGSLAAGAPVLGLEAPTASFSSYVKHSGTEGTTPDAHLILKSLFGSSSTNSTERSTTSSSTVSLVKLAAGGSDFVRGKAILLKDGTNGYSVRNVDSVATNDLSINFNLSAAPATGLGCGKCVNYKMASAGVPMTYWQYDANGGAIEMLSGVKTSSGTINIPAADAINGDFSFVASSYYFNPIVITASTKYIDFTDSSSTVAAQLEVKTYRDPKELADEIATKMTAASVDVISCVYSSSTGKFTISSDGTVLSLLFATGTNVANSAASKIGFAATDVSLALTYTGGSAISFAAPYTGTYDSENFLVAKANELFVGSATDNACLVASNVTINFNKDAIDLLSICATSGKVGSLFSGRTVDAEVVAYVQRYDVSKWLAFKNNDTVKMMYNAGRKSGSNWVAGSVVNFYSPTAKVSALSITDQDGIFVLNMTLSFFADGGQDEFYMNLL